MNATQEEEEFRALVAKEERADKAIRKAKRERKRVFRAAEKGAQKDKAAAREERFEEMQHTYVNCARGIAHSELGLVHIELFGGGGMHRYA